MKKLIILISFISSVFTFGQTTSPFQAGHYTTNFSNPRDMADPGPGLFVILYNYYLFGTKYYDKHGVGSSEIYLKQLDERLPNYKLNVNVSSYSIVPTVGWGSPFKILGGARYVAAISPVYSFATANVINERKNGLNDSIISETENIKMNGIGDMYLSPLGLVWSWDHVDLSAFYGITMPTGKYTRGGDDNLGFGFWTNQFQAFTYYYPKKDRSTAFYAGMTYELTSKIKDEDINPGDRLTLEWGISQYLTDRFEIAFSGGHDWQVIQDKGEDVYWDNSIKDKKSTLSFLISGWPWKNRLNISAKYSFDLGLRQRFKTNVFMLNLTFVTGALDGSKKKSKKKSIQP